MIRKQSTVCSYGFVEN